MTLELSPNTLKIVIAIATVLLLTSLALNWYANRKGFSVNTSTGELRVVDLDKYEKYHKLSKWIGIAGVSVLLFVFALTLANRVIPENSNIRNHAESLINTINSDTKRAKGILSSKLRALKEKLSTMSK